jgi:hypothetical protein
MFEFKAMAGKTTISAPAAPMSTPSGAQQAAQALNAVINSVAAASSSTMPSQPTQLLAQATSGGIGLASKLTFCFSTVFSFHFTSFTYSVISNLCFNVDASSDQLPAVT